MTSSSSNAKADRRAGWGSIKTVGCGCGFLAYAGDHRPRNGGESGHASDCGSSSIRLLRMRREMGAPTTSICRRGRDPRSWPTTRGTEIPCTRWRRTIRSRRSCICTGSCRRLAPCSDVEDRAECKGVHRVGGVQSVKSLGHRKTPSAQHAMPQAWSELYEGQPHGSSYRFTARRGSSKRQ